MPDQAPRHGAALAGLVLAGGQATRLGGGDKVLRPLGGRPMLAHIVERLAPQVGPLALSANGDPKRFAAFATTVLPDDGPVGPAGPLAGVLSGLRWARRQTSCARLLTVAGDTPFFPVDLAARLKAAADDQPDRIAVAASGGRSHSVFALWPVSLEADLDRFLVESPTYSVSAFFSRHDVTSVTFPTHRDIDPFFNINTPKDLADAEEIFRRIKA